MPRWLAAGLLALAAACPLRSVGPADRYQCLGPSDCNPFGQVCCGDGYCAVDCPSSDAGPNCPLGLDAGIGCDCEDGVDGGVTQGSCPNGLVCLPPDFGYPAGVCSTVCSEETPCPTDSGCLPADLTSGTCLAGCSSDADCARVGYSCAPGLSLCVPTGSATGIDPGGRAGDGGACEPTFVPAFGPDGGLVTWSPNLEVSASPETLAEVGPTVATNGQGTIAIGWSRLGSADPGVGLAVSQNGGATFAVQAPVTDAVNALQSDPTLATDSTGRFTYVWTGFDRPADNPTEIVNTHIWSATSDDALQWTAAVEVDDQGDAGNGLDKPWLAINPATQAPWVAYRAILAGVETIQLSVGAPGAQSFAASVQLDDGARPTLGRNSSQLAFDSAGNGYAAWIELGSSDPNRDEDDFDGSPLNAIRFTRLAATDAGLPGPPLTPNVLVSAVGAAVVQNQPGLAAAPDGSTLFLAYTVGLNEATDIVVTYSADHGSSWSVPVKVNDDSFTCATHFHPWMQLDTQGRLWLAWFDNRDGLGHVAWSVSTDGGRSFSPNGFASDAPFSFTTTRGAPGWVGDYLQLLASGTQLLLAWADPRSLDGTSPAYDDRSHVYFSSASLPP